MSTALVCLAAGLLCWPRGSSVAAGRARGLRGGRTGPTARLPLAALVVTTTGLAGVLVSTPVVAVLAAGAAAAGVRAWRRRATDHDLQAQVRALAEALGVLAAELRAGRTAPQAIRAAVSACPHPVTAAAIAPAIQAGRVDPSDPGGIGAALARVAAAASVSARTGCSLAAAVVAAEDDLRARSRTADELRSLVAGPRASAAVLAGLPVLGLLMGTGVGADPWRVLTTTPVGTALLLGGVGLEAAGLAWSARLVRRAARA